MADLQHFEIQPQMVRPVQRGGAPFGSCNYSREDNTVAQPVVAAKVSLPEKAAHVPLASWAPPEAFEAFMNPAPALDPKPARRFSNASQVQWRW